MPQQPAQPTGVANPTNGGGMMTFRTNTSLFRSLPIALATAACASSTRAGPPPILDKPTVESTRQIITAREIAEAHAADAYDLIAHRRPEYLTNMSRDILKPSTAPAVYLNGLPAGDIAALRQVSADVLVEVRFILPRDAVTRHGQASAGGEILLYTYDSRTAQRP